MFFELLLFPLCPGVATRCKPGTIVCNQSLQLSTLHFWETRMDELPARIKNSASACNNRNHQQPVGLVFLLLYLELFLAAFGIAAENYVNQRSLPLNRDLDVRFIAIGKAIIVLRVS